MLKKDINRKSFLYAALAAFLCAVPMQLFAAINTVYDAKLKAKQLQDQLESAQDTIVNSPLFGMAVYSGGAVILFAGAIVLVFLLVMLLKK